MDVLLILDCCYAAGAISKGSNGTMEVLAGCSREVTAAGPGGSSASGSPFTQTLIKHLRNFSTEPQGVLMSELHLHLSRDEVLDQQTPNHTIIMGHHNPIILRSSFPTGITTLAGNTISTKREQSLQALLAVSFRGDALPEVEEFVRWLTYQYPTEIAKMEVQRITLEAAFESCSTLMLLKMPTAVWARLKDDPAYSLVGFIKSGNLLGKEKRAIESTVDSRTDSTLLAGIEKFLKSAGGSLASDTDWPTLRDHLKMNNLLLPEISEKLKSAIISRFLEYKQHQSREQLSTQLVSSYLDRSQERSGHDSLEQADAYTVLEPEAEDYDQTLLLWAGRQGHEAVASLLLEEGTDVESKDKTFGQTPLLWAARNGYEAVVRLLLEKGADLESKDKAYSRTALLWAAHNGHEAVVRLLLEKGADLEPKDKVYGRTPLLWAAHNGHEAVVRLLLEKGADLESKDRVYGRTPLSWAAVQRREAVVRLLLEKGADLVSKDKVYGRTPLSWAAAQGHQAVVRLLLEKGADLETKDKDYQTPLSWATRNGNKTVIKLLLEKDADPESKDKDYGQLLS